MKNREKSKPKEGFSRIAKRILLCLIPIVLVGIIIIGMKTDVFAAESDYNDDGTDTLVAYLESNGKEFFTIVTGNGNVFYIIIDRDYLASLEAQKEAAMTELGRPFEREDELHVISERPAILDAELNMDRGDEVALDALCADEKEGEDEIPLNNSTEKKSSLSDLREFASSKSNVKSRLAEAR